MNLITIQIKNKIQNTIIEQISNKEKKLLSNNISNILNDLYNNIPSKKRISYGLYYTIKILSQYLYETLKHNNYDIISLIVPLFSLKKDYRVTCVTLGILSWHGLENKKHMKQIIPYFKQAAKDDNWIVRECAAGLFQKIIKNYPNEIQKYLKDFSTSSDPKVRRFVSETLRPVSENKWIQKNPKFSLEILTPLFQESSTYPRTSIGNNLSDLARQNPDLIYSIVKDLVNSNDNNSYWIAYRACRNLVKKEPQKVLNLLKIDEYKYKKYRIKINDI